MEAANLVYATGSFSEILMFRIREVGGFVPLHVFVLPRTLGLFLLGALAWQVGLIRRANRFIGRFWLAAALAVGASLVLTLATSARAYSGWPSLGQAEIAVERAATICRALGYAAFVLAAGTTRIGRHWLAWAKPIGRMAFTNYIAQSLALSFVFYGYGLGLFEKLDLAAGLGIVLAVYVTQVVVSGLWLKRFNYGPLEWLWRALMYGQFHQVLSS